MKPILATIAAVAFLASCKSDQEPTQSWPPPNLMLRTYDVPNDLGPQVRNLLKNVLWLDGGPGQAKTIGRAELGPNGQLVVLANEEVQRGVTHILELLAKAPPKPVAGIEISYWVVSATPAKGAPAATDANLQEVAPALAAIVKADGPQQFTLTEKLTVTSLAGEEAKVEGREAQVRQTANATAKTILANIDLRRRSQHLETRVNLTSGQIAVLGSSGTPMGDKSESVGSLYYLIRAATHDGQGT